MHKFLDERCVIQIPIYLQCICSETVGVKSADFPVRLAWVSQRVLFHMPRDVRLRQCP